MVPGQRSCEGCGQPIIRLFTLTLRLVDLDPLPSDDGTRVIVEQDGAIRVRTLTGPDLPAYDMPAHRAHACPDPGDQLGQACASPTCRRPLVPLLDAYHPECHPEVTDRLLADQRARIAAQFRPRRKKTR